MCFSLLFWFQYTAWVKPNINETQQTIWILTSIETGNIDWIQNYIIFHINAVYLKEYGCLIETLEPNRSSKSSLLPLSIELITLKSSKPFKSIGLKHTLAVSLQQSQLKHCHLNSSITVSCCYSNKIHNTCAFVLAGGGFYNYEVNAFVAALTEMQSSCSHMLADVNAYTKYLQYVENMLGVHVNGNWRNIEWCLNENWFHISLLCHNNTKVKENSFKSSNCLQTITDTSATATDIRNVLLPLPLSTLSIQTICNVLKMKLNVDCVRNDIDMSIFYISMSHLNEGIIGCNEMALRNKCAPSNDQIKQCARSAQINIATRNLHSMQTQLNRAQSECSPYTKNEITFAQHMNRKLPLPPPTPNLNSNSTSHTTESSMSPLSLCSCDFVVTRYSSKQSVMNQTKITNYINNNDNINNKHDKRAGDLEKRATQPNILERLVRQRFQSKIGFAPSTSLSIDLRKMFITILLPLILLCKMIPMSCAGEYKFSIRFSRFLLFFFSLFICFYGCF